MSTHGTALLRSFLLDPIQDAMLLVFASVMSVLRRGWMTITMWNEWLHSPSTVNGQLSLRSVRERHTQRTSITGILAFGACAVVWASTNATHIVVGHVPPPRSNGIPSLDPHFHVGFGSAVGKRELWGQLGRNATRRQESRSAREGA